MCGFALMLDLHGGPVCQERLGLMTAALRHRGPDDEGYLLGSWLDGTWSERSGPDTADLAVLPPLSPADDGRWSLGVGVRRLAVRDRGPAAHQPMATPRRTAWIAYNGELYGIASLRERLAGLGHTFSTRGDTEVLLAAWERWGAAALDEINGMWAFVVWEPARRRLWCVRDRFGIKPLYYAREGTRLVVASEIKAVRLGLEAALSPDWSAVAEYVATGLTDRGGTTCWREVRQVPPGHLLLVRGRHVEERCWASPQVVEEHQSAEGRMASFHGALDRAVVTHAEADRTVGATLSGGLDSSSIVMAAAAAGIERLDLFTASSEDPAFDERPFAAAVASAAGGRLHVATIDPARIPDELSRLLWHQDEPTVSSSVFAQWCVMREAAAAGTTVVLDGQGADELLAGYPGLAGVHLAETARTAGFGAMRRALHARAARHGDGPARLWLDVLRWSARATDRARARRVLSSFSSGLHPELRASVSVAAGEPSPNDARGGGLAAVRGELLAVSLPPLLRYLDRCAMAFSIEARVPFLDRDVVRAGSALTSADLLHDGWTKWVLRDPRWSRLPEVVRTRVRKNPFAMPDDAWWRGPLRGWLHDVLAPSAVKRQGVLDASAVAAALDRLREPRRSVDAPLWRWVNVTVWLQTRHHPAQAA
ncbi:MAG TPA: asparagine synthase (glutamine-hydrolyzing) [Vicinamibacterales bacterium]